MVLSHAHLPIPTLPHNSPYPGGRELEGGGFYPHLNPLPSRARKFIQNYAVKYNTIAFYGTCFKPSEFLRHHTN
jgi:hypothetical protein